MVFLAILVVILAVLFIPAPLYTQGQQQKDFSRRPAQQEVPQQKEPFIDLSQLIKEAKQKNPSIKAAYQTFLAAEQRITQAVSLEDPQATYGYFIDNVETRVGPQKNKYGIAQKFPFFGKLSLRGQVAQKDRDISYQRYRAVEAEVIKNLKHAFFDLYWVRKSIGITREIKELLQTLERVAEKKYTTGIVSQQDVLKAQVEISKLIDRLLVLDKQEVTLREKLNTLLNRPVETPLGEIKEPRLTVLSLSLNELFELAKKNRQELQASYINIKKYESMHSLRKKDYFPDFTLGIDYVDIGSGETSRPNDGQDAWMAMVKINLPLWKSRIGAAVKEAEDRLKASQENYQDVENQVLFQIKDFHFKLKTAEDLVNLYKTALVPQAEKSFKAALASYETGNTDFLNLIDSERVLLNFKIAYFKAITDYEKAIADLERAVGKELKDLARK